MSVYKVSGSDIVLNDIASIPPYDPFPGSALEEIQGLFHPSQSQAGDISLDYYANKQFRSIEFSIIGETGSLNIIGPVTGSYNTLGEHDENGITGSSTPLYCYAIDYTSSANVIVQANTLGKGEFVGFFDSNSDVLLQPGVLGDVIINKSISNTDWVNNKNVVAKFSPFRTPTTTPSSTPAGTPGITPTKTPTSTVTATPTATISLSVTPTRTVTSATPTITPSITPSNTKTASVTPTISITATVTPSITPTSTLSATTTPSITPTISITPTTTVTRSNTPTPTISITPSITPTNTVTPSISISSTPSVTTSKTPSITPTVTPSTTNPLDGSNYYLSTTPYGACYGTGDAVTISIFDADQPIERRVII